MTHDPLEAASSSERFGLYSAATAGVGVLASGPIALVTVALTQPQPRWVDARTYVEHFHPLQLLPFFAGFILIAGFFGLIISVSALSGPEHRLSRCCAVASATVFAALITVNYAVQVSFIPGLVQRYEASDASVLAALSMARPGSLAWTLELWGYAWMGLASWLVAPFFVGGRLEQFTRRMFVLNGVVSLCTPWLSCVTSEWMTQWYGILAFGLWNAVALAMSVGAFFAFRNRLRGWSDGQELQPIESTQRLITT
ncbi:MAG: hypothetical protein RL701_4170 [Pseudomonadota bacterium]